MNKRQRIAIITAAATLTAFWSSTLVTSAPAEATPLLRSHTTVAGHPFFGPQGPDDLHVILVAEVSPLVMGEVTRSMVTFTVGFPDEATLTFTVPASPCVFSLGCGVSTDFHAEVNCDPTDPGIWVKAAYSGETLGPRLNVEITSSSESGVSRVSRCPTESF
jgi:hypothetical protein